MGKSFGRRVLELTPTDVLAEERELGLGTAFQPLDATTAGIIKASVAGERVATLSKGESLSRLSLLPITDEDRAILRGRFLLSDQQGRGAWFLAEQTGLHVGDANLPYHSRRYPRFASGIAFDEKGKVSLRDSPEALYFWSVLGPLFEAMYKPLALRSTDAPRGDRDDHMKEWQSVDDVYRDLGIQVHGELAVFRYGGGWSKLRSAGRLAAKERLLLALGTAATGDVAARHRVLGTRKLIERYYARAKRGAPAMRQVLTKPLQQILCAFFGGDWLAFLRYIGEQPHPEERIATTLPEPKLYVTAAERVPAVAAQHGIDPAEIERMLASFWAGERATSPVDRRITALRRYWQCFDEVHSRQAPGMPPLWGFVLEDDNVRLLGADNETSGPAWYVPGTHLTLLPADLLRDVDSLWDGSFLPGHPDRVVTTSNPLALMGQALGPALRFWHGAALTAWFVSEGPHSRTDMAGLAKQHVRELSELEELGCPVDAQVFTALIAAEKELGKPTTITDPGSEGRHTTGGMTTSVSDTIGARRSGFERLRDIISRHRRDWTDRYLEAYLRGCWESEILKAAREYSRLYEHHGKAPTLKQFARFAEAPANHWFGGDVSALYAAFGEKSPVQPMRARLLPRDDTQVFMWRVFRALGGKRSNWSDLAETIVGDDRRKQDAEWRAHGDRKRLAELSVWYVQVREALGRPPSLKEFGLSKFKCLASAVGGDAEKAWAFYSGTVEEALTSRAEHADRVAASDLDRTDEHRERFGPGLGISTLWRAIAALGRTFKRKP